MKYIIIGGVAAGTKAAAKLLRQDRSAEVVIYTKSKDISYAGCGLPYYVGGSIESREALIVNTPAKFSALTGAQVRTEMEAVSVDPAAKTVSFANGETAAYDKLIIATGATPFLPDVPGKNLPGVFAMRTPEDAIGLREYIDTHFCREAVVVGAGFIGLEIAENLMAKGLKVTVIEMAKQLLPGLLDSDMADYLRRRLQKRGLRIITGTALQAVIGTDRATGVTAGAGNFAGDVVVMAVGIRPATGFVADTGIEMNRGAIVVDEHMQTSLPDIFAAGDCAQVKNRITGRGQWSAMGSTANITARVLAKHLTGAEAAYLGCLGTGVIRLANDLNAARTGLTESQAKEAGFDPVSATCVVDAKAHYYPGASAFVVKLVADKPTHKLLGMQVIGAGSVDKMADVAVTGISMGAKVGDFTQMDFAYAPPFSTAIHPFAHACCVLENKLLGEAETFTPAEYAAGAAEGYRVIDVQPTATVPGAQWVDLGKVNGPIEGIGKDEKLLLVCTRGKRAYFLQNRLKAFGYTNTRVLEAGVYVNEVKVPRAGKLSAEDIRRVKGLGFLQDKRFDDVFNARVITRNGRITVAEHRAIAEAAEKFGSGAVAMTSRMTMEIQGVKYDNVEPLMAFLAEHGLMTGGTGSLVRPVVSCKGTTCQYGLCDTFGLSEKIHERFYLGYHTVTLPHKFKIAVGGCPNNCVKPDLNDLGVIGQRVPLVDYSKCRGCKICQVENSCPIKIAKVQDGVIRIDPNECNNCGRCKGKCPFGALEEYQEGYRVYIGGRWGKKVARGQALTRVFTSEEEVLDVIEKAILLFRDEGITGERFADTVARLGFDYVNDKLIHGAIDKSAILGKDVRGGATC